MEAQEYHDLLSSAIRRIEGDHDVLEGPLHRPRWLASAGSPQNTELVRATVKAPEWPRGG